MASLLFLLSLLLTTTTTTSTATGIPPNPPPTSPLFPLSPPSPPPPPLPQDPIQEAHFNTIIDAILNAGDFRNWANLLSQLDPSSIPFSATIFVPDDTAFLRHPPPATVLTFIDPLLFPYHITPHRFIFSELRLFPAGARLPTLLAGKTLLITNNSAVNFTVDGARVTRPDLYENGAVAVHGVGGVLDYALFGNDESPLPENDAITPSLVTDVGVSVSGGNGVPAVVTVSGGARLLSCSWVTVVVVVCVVMFLIRILGFLRFEIVCSVERSRILLGVVLICIIFSVIGNWCKCFSSWRLENVP